MSQARIYSGLTQSEPAGAELLEPLAPNEKVPIPMKPLRSEMIAPPVSGMIPPPCVGRGIAYSE